MPVRRVLITRPREDATDLATALQGLGVEYLSEPLLEISCLAPATCELDGVQAVLLTSLNGVRALAQATARRDLRLIAVGDASAALARRFGFRQVASAAGDGKALAAKAIRELDPQAGPLIHVSGKAVAGNLVGELAAAGFDCRHLVLYEARPATVLTPACLSALRENRLDAVLFFSPRTAATFVRLAEAAMVAGCCARLLAVCLSSATAAAAGAVTWQRILVAAAPNQAALLQRLQQEVDGG